MPLELKITSYHKELLSDDSARLFDSGGTIGRGLQNDWILPDPDRFLSGRHATLDCQSGAWYLADISTNGVYINDESEPLGKGNPRRLFNGDRLRMGDFEFVVLIDGGESLTMPADPTSRNAFSSEFELQVDEAPLKTGIQLLDEEALTGDNAFQSALFGTTKMDSAVRGAGESAVRKINNRPVRQQKSANEPHPKSGSRDAGLLNVFLAAAGVDRADLHPSINAEQIMQNAGEVLREFVTGITEQLTSRANLKSMFRLDQTTVLPRHNNPLKVAANADDSMKQLLVGKEGEYLGPIDSVREVCRDLKFHQDAMMSAMTSAFREFADRFDPDELQESFERNMERKPLIGSLAKLKYWQFYCDLYPIMTQNGSGPFPQQFGEEFVRCYERHIAEYKRNERKDGEAA